MYLYIKKHTGVSEIPKWEKVCLKMEAIVIVTCIGPILGNNFKFSPFSRVKRNLLPQKSILHAKTRCTNSQQRRLALQPKPCPFPPQDRGRVGALLAFPGWHSVPSAQGVCWVWQPLLFISAPSALLHQSRRHCTCLFQWQDNQRHHD